jgi:hypothetical protein
MRGYQGIAVRGARTWRGAILAAALASFAPADAWAQVDLIFMDGFEADLARAQLVINEVDYDQIGLDTNEFIEVFNPGPSHVPLSGIVLILINGATSPPSPYNVIDLYPAEMLTVGQYLVVASNTVVVDPGARVIRFAAASDNVQNGAPDGILLGYCVTTPTGTTSQYIDGLSYEGAVAPVDLPPCGTANLVEGTALPVSVADSNTVAGSLSRIPNGSDTDDAATDWAFTTTPTPGTANVP